MLRLGLLLPLRVEGRDGRDGAEQHLGRHLNGGHAVRGPSAVVVIVVVEGLESPFGGEAGITLLLALGADGIAVAIAAAAAAATAAPPIVVVVVV